MAQKFDFDRLKRLASSEGFKGIDEFVDAMPHRVSKSILIAAGVVWATVAIAVVFANIKTEDITKLRADVLKAEAVVPKVPNINEIPVSADEIQSKITVTEKVYEGISFKIQEGGIQISSNDQKLYGPFMQSIYSVMSLGAGYKITLTSYCEGKNCQQSDNKPFLYAVFSVKKLEVKSSESP